MRPTTKESESIQIQVGAAGLELHGDLSIPEEAIGVVVFAHGSGSNRHSPRNRLVARQLYESRLATLLVDLLTPVEETADRGSGHFHYTIDLLADRLVGATDWVVHDERTSGLFVGYFGASTGGGAALVAAARRPDLIAAVVFRGGHPELAGEALPNVLAPTLLIVGGEDMPVILLNERAYAQLGTHEKKLVVVPGASHLFEEPGTLGIVADLAVDWFTQHLRPSMIR